MSRAIYDQCIPDMLVTVSPSASYSYRIGDGVKLIVDLANFQSGDCETEIQINLLDEGVVQTLPGYYSYSVVNRQFTTSAPYTNVGSETKGTIELTIDTSDNSNEGIDNI